MKVEKPATQIIATKDEKHCIFYGAVRLLIAFAIIANAMHCKMAKYNNRCDFKMHCVYNFH